MTEDEVISCLAKFFEASGRRVVGRCFVKQKGVDLAVQWSVEELLFVEAKGLRNVNNRGRAISQLVWDSGYARLPQLAEGRKGIRREGKNGNSILEVPSRPRFVGLAVPDTRHFREHAAYFMERMRQVGDGLWFVGPDRVDEHLTPT